MWTNKTPSEAGGEHSAQAGAGAGSEQRRGRAAEWASTRRARRAAEWGKTTYTGSWAENLWQRLDAVDFLNQAMQLAGTLLLCAVPFMLIASALAGRSAMTTLTSRLGLSHQAATDVGHLFAASSTTVAAVTGLSWVFFILGGIAAVGAIQRLYQQVFQIRPQGMRDRLHAVAWLALAIGWTALGTVVGRALHSNATVLWWLVNVPALIGFWWLSMWILLAGKVAWRRLLPCAVATALFWIGMLVVFHFTLSGMITGNYQKYGAIGVVFALMSFFIAVGVVIILGAATGMMWQERGMSFRAALRRLRRAS